MSTSASNPLRWPLVGIPVCAFALTCGDGALAQQASPLGQGLVTGLRWLDFTFRWPHASNYPWLAILFVLLVAGAYGVYRLTLQGSVRAGMHPRSVRLSLVALAGAAFLMTVRVFHLVQMGGGWVLLSASVIVGLVSLLFTVRKLVPLVGGMTIGVVAVTVLMEFSGMLR